MSDESPKELSPEAQHKQDLGRVQTQIGVTDVRRQVSEILNDILPFGGSLPLLARTSFEAHDLNVMVDLATNSNPEDLENAGSALWKARDALKDAAKELEDYVGTVEWKGESEVAFRTFGKALVAHARALGGFADAAGTQITVAGTGLASVRHAVQGLRDNRADRKTVDDVPLPARVEGNAEYDGAMKAEKNRQEAINQMNRLASFYAVSEETLAAQEPPKLNAVLKADVPPPTGAIGPGSTSGATATGVEASGTTAPQALASHADSSGTSGASRVESVGTVAPVPDRNTSMEIDSVATPPVPTTSPSAPPTTTAPGPANPAIGGQVPPMANGFANPVRGGGTARSTGVSGRGPGGANAVGRPGNAGTGSAATGRTGGTGPVGRPGPIGSGPPATGRPGAVGPAGQSPMVGRPGSAGQPMAGRAGTSGAGAPRAGRGDGVMGGTPQRSATGSAGSRIPRGTVIGGDGAASGRPSAARPSHSGVVGANPANGAPRSTGRGTPSTNGVVGTPRNGAPGSRPGARGFTAGGAGFVGGRPGQRQSDDEEQERTGSARPDYLTEDEETWATRRRGAVPPVID